MDFSDATTEKATQEHSDSDNAHGLTDSAVHTVVKPLHRDMEGTSPADPIVWFGQAEAQFATPNITSDQTKHHHIVSALQPEIAVEVRDLIINPPVEKPYATLKAELIKRTTASEQRRVQLLLSDEELGDKKPSQLLRRMRQLLGERHLEEGIFKELFLQRLPPNVRVVLAASVDAVSVDALSNLADRIMDVHFLKSPRRHL
ncbi:uncharacterized protein [Diadema antillarum]|uniref:uncharacterized protein n=1 Tax=Diadema antillarum TaxID=105358 RepID=UPI003A8B5EC9